MQLQNANNWAHYLIFLQKKLSTNKLGGTDIASHLGCHNIALLTSDVCVKFVLSQCDRLGFLPHFKRYTGWPMNWLKAKVRIDHEY